MASFFISETVKLGAGRENPSLFLSQDTLSTIHRKIPKISPSMYKPLYV